MVRSISRHRSTQYDSGNPLNADIEAEDSSDMTAAFSAVEKSNGGILSLLLDRGADINAQLDSGESLLQFACKGKGNVKILQLLLDRGADSNMLTKSGKSAVHIAAGYPNIAMLDCLIDYGAPFDTVDNKGVTPLFFAARRGELGVVTALMKRGARHDISDATGETLLHIAVSHIWPEVVEIVLRTQSVNALDMAGRSPLHHAYFTSAQASYGGLLYVMTADVIRRLVDKGSFL